MREERSIEELKELEIKFKEHMNKPENAKFMEDEKKKINYEYRFRTKYNFTKKDEKRLREAEGQAEGNVIEQEYRTNAKGEKVALSMKESAILSRRHRAKIKQAQGYSLERRKPVSVSPDYQAMLYDQVGEDLVVNEKKREDLLISLDYQFEIYYTEVFFKDFKGEEIRTKDFEELKKYIVEGRIDLSFGIYAKQQHHRQVSRRMARYKGFSNEGILRELRNFIKKGYKVVYQIPIADGKKSVTIEEERELYAHKEILPYDGFIIVVKEEYKSRTKDKWNIEYDGAWISLSKIPTPEQIQKFRERRAYADIKRAYRYANGVSSCRGRELETFKRVYNYMDEKYAKESIKNDKIIYEIEKVYPSVFKGKRNPDIYGFIRDIFAECLFKDRTYEKLAIEIGTKIIERINGVVRPIVEKVEKIKKKRVEYDEVRNMRIEYDEEGDIVMKVKLEPKESEYSGSAKSSRMMTEEMIAYYESGACLEQKEKKSREYVSEEDEEYMRNKYKKEQQERVFKEMYGMTYAEMYS